MKEDEGVLVGAELDELLKMQAVNKYESTAVTSLSRGAEASAELPNPTSSLEQDNSEL